VLLPQQACLLQQVSDRCRRRPSRSERSRLDFSRPPMQFVGVMVSWIGFRPVVAEPETATGSGDRPGAPAVAPVGRPQQLSSPALVGDDRVQVREESTSERA
jgi:hypothetical protein